MMRFIFLIIILSSCSNTNNQKFSEYQDLILLFQDWRDFEEPNLINGVHDYSKKSFDQRRPLFNEFKSKLLNFDTSGWTVNEQIDWHIVLAEMNGYDFNEKVLMPWVRDPAFYQSVWMYQSDVPAHEGPTNHGVLEFWMYDLPLSNSDKEKIKNEIDLIPIFQNEARKNLTGNARELWIAGIENLDNKKTTSNNKNKLGYNEDDQINVSINNAIESNDKFIQWLEEESKTKTGPSGIGKENYTWYQQNVHLLL